MPTNISVAACTGSHAALSRSLALACSEASVCPRPAARSSSWMSARRQDSAKKVLKVSSRAPGAMAEQSLTATAGSQSWRFLARRHRDKVQMEGVRRQPNQFAMPRSCDHIDFNLAHTYAQYRINHMSAPDVCSSTGVAEQHCLCNLEFNACHHRHRIRSKIKASIRAQLPFNRWCCGRLIAKVPYCINLHHRRLASTNCSVTP